LTFPQLRSWTPLLLASTLAPSPLPALPPGPLAYSLLLVVMAAGCAACSAASEAPARLYPKRARYAESPSAQQPAGPTQRNPWTQCYAGFRQTGNPRGDLARLTRACGKLGGMRPVTRVLLRHQAASEPAARYTFYVTHVPSCYRIFAAADRHIADLDLLLHGPDGDRLVGDLTHDAWPVLPPHGPLCLDVPGLYMLEVSVFQGTGHYAVQVWGS
jgi:hypothetical protein